MSESDQPPTGWRVVEPGERIEASDVEAAPLTFGSLFAGIGGMDLGLERAGMECRWQVEIDPYATRVLARHWPDVRRHDDVRTFPPDDGTDWQVDLIAGGFPCQDISYAGKGAGLSGERSGLWFEFARVVRTLRPRFLIVENVPALLTRGLDAVLGTLASLGYDAEWTCLPAAAVGAPHIRDRVFILAYSQCSRCETRGRCEGSQGKRWAESGACCQNRDLRLRDDVPDAQRPRLEIGGCFGGDARAELQAAQRANRAGGVCWGRDPAEDPQSGMGGMVARLSAGMDGGLSNEGEHRETTGSAYMLSGVLVGDRPAKRHEAMGWEGLYVPRVASDIPHRVDRLRGLGNAVVPQVAEWIGQRIIEAANQEQTCNSSNTSSG